MSRRVALAALVLVTLAAALVMLPRLRTVSRPAAGEGGAGVASASEEVAEPAVPTGEALSAAAVKAGDLTYEESLLQRAYAVFGDPRLEPAFRSQVVDWESLGTLLDEISEKEATLGQELLQDLMPFRVRPSDPASIVNRQRDEVVRTQAATAPAWVSQPVPGTDLRVWIQVTQQDLAKYSGMAGRIWRAFPAFFTYPLKDQPGNQHSPFNSVEVNPDNRIDIYLIDGAALDPRLGDLARDVGVVVALRDAVEGPSPSAY